MFSLLAGKFIGVVGLIASVGIAIHIGLGALTSYVAELEVTKIAYDQQTALLEQRDEQLLRLQEAHRKAADEVEWARTYVSKQERKIEQLTEEASIEVQDCLNLEISSEFVQ